MSLILPDVIIATNYEHKNHFNSYWLCDGLVFVRGNNRRRYSVSNFRRCCLVWTQKEEKQNKNEIKKLKRVILVKFFDFGLI